MSENVNLIKIKVDCKNKSKSRQYAFEWDSKFDTLADGEEKYDSQSWLDGAANTMAKELSVCMHHSRFIVKLKETDGNKIKYSQPLELNSSCFKYTKASRDKIFFKLDDTTCDKDSCLIKKYGSTTKNRKRKLSKKQKRPSKKRKKEETSTDEESNDNESCSDSEDDDVYDGDSTSSDDYDKKKQKQKGKKRGKKKRKSPALYGRFIETLTTKFGGLIELPGIVEMAEIYFEKKKFPTKVPEDILTRHRIKSKSFSTRINHNNYGSVSRTTRPPYYNPRHDMQSSTYTDNQNGYHQYNGHPNGYHQYKNGNSHNHNQHPYQYQYQHQYQDPMPPPLPQPTSNLTTGFPSPSGSDDDGNTNTNSVGDFSQQ